MSMISASEGYNAALDSAAVFADRDRRVVRIAGRRAFQVVNGLVTNSIDDIGEGRARYSFLLDPKGRPVAEVRILPSPGFHSPPPGAEESLLFDVPGIGLEALSAHLGRYVPPIFAEVSVLDLTVITVAGPAAPRVATVGLEAAGLSASRSPDGLGPLEVGSLGVNGLVARREGRELDGLDVYVTAETASAVREALGAEARALGGAAATPEDWDILRIELGVPAFGREITPDRLAQEAGQDERAISFEKGCFTGQEVVARIHYRGHVNRHLRGVRAADPALLRTAELFADARAVASVHSVVVSPRLGPIGLGYVRREIELGALLAPAPEAEAVVEVVELPFTHR